MLHDRSNPKKQTALFLAGLFVSVSSVLPIIWLIFTSFKTHGEIVGSKPTFFPRTVSLGHYARIFMDHDYIRYIWNSCFVAIVTTVAVVLLSIIAGYGYSKFFKFRGQGMLLLFVLVSRMLPPIAIVVPLYDGFSKFGLLDTKTGLVLISSAISLPLGTWMLKTFFDEIPSSVVDAATIDGCNPMSVLWNIILPLSKSAIASTVTITFLTAWNLFLIPLIFGKSLASKTLPVAISSLAFGEYGTQWGDLAALSVIMIVPVALIGLFGQRYLATGLTTGAEKG